MAWCEPAHPLIGFKERAQMCPLDSSHPTRVTFVISSHPWGVRRDEL